MKKKMVKSYYIKVIFILLTIAVMVIIFLFSGENSDKSSDTSGKVTEFILSIFVKDFRILSSKEQYELIKSSQHLIRKLAHFSVYTALGFSASFAVGKRKLISINSAAVLLFCFMYACTDEFHQTFISGRSGQFTDVLIDTSGGLTGITISVIMLNVISNKKS